MKIVIAPDSFKHSISAVSLCREIEKGIRERFPLAEIVKLPVSDGGEGFIDAIASARLVEMVQKNVTGPKGEKVSARYCFDNDRAYLELAQSSGLQLVKNSDPQFTTTYGFGELLSDALQRGFSNFIIGIGGSATNDGGAGMAQALGYQFFDGNNNLIAAPMTGELIGWVNKIHKPNLPAMKITAACDVTNRLLGPKGAVYTYAKQKGARDLMSLERNLENLANQWEKWFNQKVRFEIGAGAAGGLGGGLMAFFNGELKSGAKFVLDLLHFDDYISHADMVITGEGKIDNQTHQGKILSEIIKRVRRKNRPLYAICGILEKNCQVNKNFEKIIQLREFGGDSLNFPEKYIQKAVKKLFE